MQETVRHAPVIILGTGPAGYTAAIYTARANLKPLLITGMQQGGQLTTTTEVGNWPGGPVDLEGPGLMESMQHHAERLGVEIIRDHIDTVHLNVRPFHFSGNQAYTCNALIIATGARAKYLGLPSELAFQGRGVSACATCDGFLYRNQTVAVVGGGNTALEEALYLSHMVAKIILIHRRDTFRAEKMLQDKFFERVKQGRIQLQLNTVVNEIQGDDTGVTAVQLKSVATGELSSIQVKCVFIAIGHHPNTGLFEEQLALKDGYIVLPHSTSLTKHRTATTIPGVFAAGDVADPIYRQAITAAGSGCMAAMDVEKYLEG
jgi:thioredoxin-disulfide reductase